MAFRRRMFRRKRRPVEWFQSANPAQTGLTPTSLNTNLFDIVVDGSVAQAFDVSNIIIGDAPEISTMLGERKTYTVDRIVGRIEVQIVGTVATDSTYSPPGPVDYAWGLFVSDVDDTGAPLDLDVFDLFSTRGQEASWLHRDRMVLGLNESNGALSVPGGYNDAAMAALCYPSDNLSRAPWGMIDVHVKRHIAQSQRFFIMHAAIPNNSNWPYTTNPTKVVGFGSLRVLGHWTNR